MCAPILGKRQQDRYLISRKLIYILRNQVELRPDILRPLKALSAIHLAAILILENEYGHGILRGIGEFARLPSLTQVHVLKFSKTDRFDEAFLHGLDVDGLIVKVSHPDEEEMLLRLGMPVVNISGQVRTPRLMTVMSDDRLVGKLAAQYFLRRRLRHLAYCGGILHRSSIERRDGFVEGAEGRAGRIHVHVVPAPAEMKLQPERMRRLLGDWLARLPKPVGIFAFSDFVAYEIAMAVEEAGLRCPEDVAILGVGNDVTHLGLSAIEISSIELNTRQIGWMAAEQVTGMITGARKSAAEPAPLLIKPLKIVTRRSTDRYAVQDETVSQALDFIRENAGNTIYVDDVVRAVATSRRTLEMRFRNTLGTSIYQIVQRTHVDRAAELLARPDLTLEEVAYLSGHENARHLCLAFRRLMKTTPASHRRALASFTA